MATDLVELFGHYHRTYSAEKDDEKLSYKATEQIENLLHSILKNHLIPRPSKDELLDENKPLSGYRGKANLAYRLGIISKGLRDELLVIRSIRKKFRESIDCFELDYRDASVYCAKLKAPELLINKASSSHFRQKFRDTPRGRFELAVSVMSSLLHDILDNTERISRQPLH